MLHFTNIFIDQHLRIRCFYAVLCSSILSAYCESGLPVVARPGHASSHQPVFAACGSQVCRFVRQALLVTQCLWSWNGKWSAKSKARELITDCWLAVFKRDDCPLASAHWARCCQANSVHQLVSLADGVETHERIAWPHVSHRILWHLSEAYLTDIGAAVCDTQIEVAAVLATALCQRELGTFPTHYSRTSLAESGGTVCDCRRRSDSRVEHFVVPR